jgi:hypothetical protein
MEHEDHAGHDEERAHVCRECDSDLSGYRKDALYCDDACRKRYTRAEKRLEDRRNSYLSSNYQEMSLEELHALMEAEPPRSTREVVDEGQDDTGQEILAGLERMWSESEHRNPGVAHPDRLRARIDEQRALKAAEEKRFTRKPETIAEAGRARRGLSGARSATPEFNWE